MVIGVTERQTADRWLVVLPGPRYPKQRTGNSAGVRLPHIDT
jgi:hypothetical protein